jgi:hypothetical protein
MTEKEQFQQMAPKLKIACQCQAKEVFKQIRDNAAIAEYESFMAGKSSHISKSETLNRVAQVFNGSKAKCQKEAMK